MPLSCIRQRVINGYQHIMARPIVRGWVFLVILHFIVQVALQGVTLRDNKQAKNATGLCLSLAHVPVGLPLLEGDDLSICDGIPEHSNVTCILIASAGKSLLTSLTNVDANFLTGFGLDGIHSITLSGSEHFITGRCVLSLQWIHDILRDNTAEDIATICFQFWLLIVSLLAVMQDSIPHLAVCIAGHLLDVAWAGFRIRSTVTLRRKYYQFVVDGACGGKDMLENWWDQRLAHAAPLFGTNVITLILLGALSVALFRRYAKLNFSRAGAPAPITRMYKIALSFSALLQLAALFTIMAVGMWIDRVSDGAMSILAYNIRIYKASFFVLAAIIGPWITFGWWAIFREIKWAFILFGGLHLFLLTLWPAMFASTIYRYVFVTWSFFACVSVTSYLLVIATTIMAIICRLNFGRGLGHFLRVEADLSSSGFPGSFFTNDPGYIRNGSPTSFDVSFLDAEKARKGSTEDDKGGLMHIRPYTPDSSKYPVHSLPFETSAGDLKTPVTTAFPPPGVTNAAIVRAPNEDRENHLPTMMVDSGSRPVSYISLTNTDGPKSAVFTPDKKKSWIQPPPEAHIQAPHKETRSRKETPSLITQATCASTNSFSRAVITFAMKSPVVSATARTMVMNTIPEQRPGPAGDVGDTQQTTQSAASAIRETVDGTGQDVPSKANLPSQPDNCGRI